MTNRNPYWEELEEKILRFFMGIAVLAFFFIILSIFFGSC